MENFILSSNSYFALIKVGGNDAVSLFLYLLSNANSNGEIDIGVRALSKSAKVGFTSTREVLRSLEFVGVIVKRDKGFTILNVEKYAQDIEVVSSHVSKTIEERKLDFQDSLKPFINKYGRDCLNEFYIYWTQISRGERKMLFEKQKSFQIPNRLALWKRNQKNTSSDQILNSNESKDYTKGLWE